MEKVVIHSPGGYDKLKLVRTDDLSPKEGEVLVQTKGIGVNYADCCIRWGIYESANKFVGWPITPGFEFSGVVTAVGSKVKSVQVGAKVFGVSFFNGYASQVCVPENRVLPLPDTFSFEEAAGFPAVFLTAYHALFQNVKIYPGSTLLIHSAAGGVGSSLVQLSKAAGFKTIAVVGSSHKVSYVKELGADFVIDKSKQSLWREVEKIAPQGLDIVLDANGPSTLKEGYRHLRPTGKLISYGFHSMLPQKGMKGRMNYLKAAIGLAKMPRFNPLVMTNENKGVVCFNLSFLFNREELLNEAMSDLLQWVKEGKIRAPKVTTFPMCDVAKAHQSLESGMTVGKLILVP